MVNNEMPTSEELQEKALYDLIQYLPLDQVTLKDGYTIYNVIEEIEKKSWISKSDKAAVDDNLPTIKAILNDRPELGEAKIGNMSWQDNDDDGSADHPVLGMQACTFETDDHVYISFRGTPKRGWLDNGKAFAPDNIAVASRYYEREEAKIRKLSGPLSAMGYRISKKIEQYNEKKRIEEMGDLNGIFPPEIYNYTSPLQEEAIYYIEELKNPANGSISIFDQYENVYVTGHSKGGNEATLVTMLYPNLIDRCISGNGQGFSPEFVSFVKKTIGEKDFSLIQEKMWGFYGENDPVSQFGVVVIKEENRIYFAPEIAIESPAQLIYNHYPTGMANSQTGKIAQITEQGTFGKFVASVNEKLLKLNVEDRSDVSITVMNFFQSIYANADSYFNNLDELNIDKLDVEESSDNGFNVLKKIVIKTLMEEEGEAFIRDMAVKYGDKYPYIEKISKAYDSLEMGDGFEKLVERSLILILPDIKEMILPTDIKETEDYNQIAMEKERAFNVAYSMGGEYAAKYSKFGTYSDIGVVAINYEKTKELIIILDEMDNLVVGKILPEMDSIADDLRRMRYWKVNVSNWTDIRDSISESNNQRLKLKERLIHYCTVCESMESKFVEGMGK